MILQEHNNVQITGTSKKPVHTWSAVVKSKDGKESSEAIINKLNKEIGPTSDVRVHEVKPIKSSGEWSELHLWLNVRRLYATLNL